MESLAKKHVVIFGCGYVGSALAEAALSRGARVTALTRNEEKAAALRARGVEVLRADLASDEWHARLDTGADFAANTVSASASTPEGYRASYVDGMRSILAWAKRAPVGTLVYTSSTGVYPQGGGARIDETASTDGASPTGRVLVEAENLLRADAAAVRRWFVLRCAGIYGPGRHYLLNALRAGQTRFGGEPTFRMNLIHRDDLVAAMLACFAAPPAIANEIFNLSDGAPATRGELVGWLAERLGLPAPIFDGAVPSARKGGEPTPDRVIVAEKIRHALGWVPVFADFRAGYAPLLLGQV